ncbi:MAG: PD-(D/E)XK nuclease family protein [Acidobacteria bacterium]|nr:PD-(D/E)XK nuclease family protein [Acidobacteriota bacterium]
MTSRRFILQQASEALARGATVLTSNDRAARTLRRELAADLNRGDEVLPLSAWISSQWQHRLISGAETRVPLTGTQEQRLWEEVIAAEEELHSLLPPARLAEMAGSAARLLYEWNARALFRSATVEGDPAIFLRWLTAFERKCKLDGWIPRSAITRALAEATANDANEQAPAELFLIGVERLTPAQQLLMDAYAHKGARVQFAEASPNATGLYLAECVDSADEFSQCALWAAKKLGENRSVAIIHADPAAVRPALERAFCQHLAPQKNDVSQTTVRAPYEFSLGVPLRSTLMVRHALLLLQWLTAPMDIELVSEIIRSPYFATADTLATRAEFDAFGLREASSLRAQRSIFEVIALMREMRHGAQRWPSLESFAHQLASAAKTASFTANAGWMDWAEHAAFLLTTAGWNSGRTEGSYEYQLRQRWQETLDELARMQALNERVSWTTALSTLEALTAQTLFAPQSHNAPVQVMSPMEAAGSEFDALWFLGADDLQWPTSSTPHPLLPFPLQHRTAMPGTHPEDDLARSSEITTRLLRSADEVVVSYAARTAAGEHARISRLLPASQMQPFPRNENAEVRPSIQLNTQIDTDTVPAPPSALRGGAGLLEAQAACSFRAFAERRLFSAEPGASEDGMDALERGTMLHELLEEFWLAVGSRRQLEKLSTPTTDGSPTQRDARLRAMIHNKLSRASASAWEQSYLDLEAERLFHLLSRWLDFELDRPDFSIHSTEQKIPGAEIGPVKIDLRVDRIDRVHTTEGDALLLIDYKTGPASPADWNGDRPERPQLPLYAAAAKIEGLAGIAFASLRAGEKGIALRGVSGLPGVFGPKDKPIDFEEQVYEWQHVLTTLAEQFAAGTAEVSPKRFPTTCTYCRQHILCRVHTLKNETADEEDGVE